MRECNREFVTDRNTQQISETENAQFILKLYTPQSIPRLNQQTFGSITSPMTFFNNRTQYACATNPNDVHTNRAGQCNWKFQNPPLQW